MARADIVWNCEHPSGPYGRLALLFDGLEFWVCLLCARQARMLLAEWLQRHDPAIVAPLTAKDLEADHTGGA